MGFLDRLLKKNRPAASAPETEASGPAPSAPRPLLGALKHKPTGGPLDLAVGDFVIHYRARFAVVGVRVLEDDRTALWQYCLRDDKGGSAVLAGTEGRDPSYTLQRSVTTKAAWEGDVANDVPEGPYTKKRHGRRKVRSWGDAGIPAGAKSVEVREFADAAGDRQLVVEDYQGRRESRLAESVLEAELDFERAAGNRGAGTHTAALAAGAGDFEDDAEQETVKGSPRAAAKVLGHNVGVATAAAAPKDPKGYGDDAWVDAVEEPPTVRSRTRLTPNAKKHDEEEEWVSAAEIAKEQR